MLGSPPADSNSPIKEWQNQIGLIHRSIMVAFDDKSSLAYRVVAVDISRALGIICREIEGDLERSDSVCCLEQTKRMGSR